MDDLFETVADGALGKPTESISLAGFQVTRAEFFANMQEPTLTVWPGRIKFSIIHLQKNRKRGCHSPSSVFSFAAFPESARPSPIT